LVVVEQVVYIVVLQEHKELHHSLQILASLQSHLLVVGTARLDLVDLVVEQNILVQLEQEM
jgi:hypothetical protein